MWFGLVVEVGLLQGHFPECCFLCLWKVFLREVEFGKEMNLIAVQIFSRASGIVTIIPPVDGISWQGAAWGTPRAPELRELLHSGADFAGLQPFWDKNSPVIRFIPHVAICSWSLPCAPLAPGRSWLALSPSGS